jgi:YVTN family beta-propeller protein
MTDDRLVVLNKDSDTLSIVDPETGETERVVETDFNPHEVAIGPESEVVYVTCSLGDSLLTYDAETWEILDRFEHEQFDFPHGLAVRESADELWLASTYSSEVFVFDVTEGVPDLIEHFPTYQDKSHMVALTPDEGTAFVANIGGDNVTAVDAEERAIRADIPVGEGPEGIEVHPEAGLLVANQDDARLTVVDPDTFETEGQALLGETPIRVVSSPDGRHVLVPNRESNDVSVIDTAHERDGERGPWEIARIPVGRWPGGTVFSPDGDRAFVANNKTNDVSVLDPAARTEIERYGTELHPDGIAYLER